MLSAVCSKQSTLKPRLLAVQDTVTKVDLEEEPYSETLQDSIIARLRSNDSVQIRLHEVIRRSMQHRL